VGHKREKSVAECVYAEQENNNVTVKSLSRFLRGFLNATIAEVDIGRETFKLKSVKY
jgi:hypothetical protein